MRGYQGNSKLNIDATLKLDIKTFKFNRADNGTIKILWKNKSNMAIKKKGDSLIFDYNTIINGQKKHFNYHVGLEYTSCNYGGERKWFICPHCFKKVCCLHLRNGVFRCRNCQRLNYTLQQESKADYSLDSIDHRVYKIQDKLKAKRDISNIDHIEKPKGMRWETYSKLMLKLYELKQERDIAFCKLAGGFMSKI